jgi:hypothetical protein
MNSWKSIPRPLTELREYASHQPLPRLAQIAKFGIPGTDMPGHEYLNDRQIASLALFLKLAPVQSVSRTSTH